MLYAGKDMELICTRLAKALVTKETSMVTVYYGEDVTEEQAAAIEEQIQAKFGAKTEITVINGGQPIYYYILSVE